MEYFVSDALVVNRGGGPEAQLRRGRDGRARLGLRRARPSPGSAELGGGEKARGGGTSGRLLRRGSHLAGVVGRQEPLHRGRGGVERGRDLRVG